MLGRLLGLSKEERESISLAIGKNKLTPYKPSEGVVGVLKSWRKKCSSSNSSECTFKVVVIALVLLRDVDVVKKNFTIYK